MDVFSVRDLELIRHATAVAGKMRNGTAVSEEMASLHKRVLCEIGRRLEIIQNHPKDSLDIATTLIAQ